MSTDEATREFSAEAQELGEKIVGLTLKEAKEVSDYLEEVHGIKPAAGGGVVMAAPAAGDAAAAEADAEPTEFDVILEDYGGKAKKVPVIKVVRAATALALKEAKDLVEACESGGSRVKEGISKEDAEKLKSDLEEAGATVAVKAAG